MPCMETYPLYLTENSRVLLITKTTDLSEILVNLNPPSPVQRAAQQETFSFCPEAQQTSFSEF